MKPTLLQTIALISVLLFSTSCSEDEPAPVFPTPTFQISGQTVDPATGATSLWATNSVITEFDSEGFRIKAVDGNDTLFIAIAGVDSGEYVIDQESELAALNRYESLGENGFTLYTFQANGNGGGIFNITQNDTINQTISGNFFVKYFNPINNSDFFELNDGQFRNIPYDTSDEGTGNENTGLGSISFTAGETDYSYEMASGLAEESIITLSGSTPPQGIPSMTIGLADSIQPGTYLLDGTTPITALFVQSVTEFFAADSGSMEIVAHDTINNNISGNFAFKGLLTSGVQDSILITNGTFDMNYLE